MECFHEVYRDVLCSFDRLEGSKVVKDYFPFLNGDRVIKICVNEVNIGRNMIDRGKEYWRTMNGFLLVDVLDPKKGTQRLILPL